MTHAISARHKSIISAFVTWLVLSAAAHAQSTVPSAPAAPKAAASAATAAAGSVMVAGVPFEPKIDLAGSSLRLNGTGIRTRAIFKVYAAGLYLNNKADTPTAIYTNKGPKRLKVTMLRELDSTSFGKTMMEVMGNNLPRDRVAACIPGIMKLGEIFAGKKKMDTGEWYTVDDIPGKGTVVSINGAQVATIEQPEFFTCLMHNYFGDKPADTDLKAGLLGLKR